MPQGLKNIYHLAVAVFATVFFRFPAKNLTVIGVTGTDGKTTTAFLIYEILKKAGKKVSLISSVGAKIGGKDYPLPFHVTTPSPWQLQHFLRMAVDRGEEDVILEVTSHALDQNRVFGCHFKMAVLTNISKEHLDYHQTYRRYLETKAKLFQGVKWAILNREDPSYEYLKLKIGNCKLTKILSYGLKNGDVTLSKFSFETPLPGDYNQLNCLAAVAATRTLGIDETQIRQVLAEFKGVVGRFEFIETDQNFRVLVDFAHTPNALENLLLTLRPQVSGRLIHVFGAAGLRDRQKRPKMGEISGKYADVIILTEEDYRTENLGQIIKEIKSGVAGKKVYEIPQRQEAIDFAIKMAQKGDLVLLTGKGHEKSLCRGKQEFPWGEQEAVKKSLLSL